MPLIIWWVSGENIKTSKHALVWIYEKIFLTFFKLVSCEEITNTRGARRSGVGQEGEGGREGSVSAFHSVSTGRQRSPLRTASLPRSFLWPALIVTSFGTEGMSPYLFHLSSSLKRKYELSSPSSTAPSSSKKPVTLPLPEASYPVKIYCPWYVEHWRIVTFLLENNILRNMRVF